MHEKSYRTNDMPSFRALIEDYLAHLGHRNIAASCFGVPGPVIDGRAEVVVNVQWTVDSRDIGEALGHSRVDLVNDLVAMGYGVLALPEEGFATLSEGEPEPGANRALIAAGTGLGHGILIHDRGRWIPVPSEGGHVDFAPGTETEIDLLRYLWNIYGRISLERVVSGPGLYAIYQFLRETGRGVEPDWLREEMKEADPSSLISKYGLNDEDTLCAQALDLFVQMYGAGAGNFALATLARGGIYLGGGIPPKILPRLMNGRFMEGFTNKGRLSGFVRQIPVKVILEPKAPLFGAAKRAIELLDELP